MHNASTILDQLPDHGDLPATIPDLQEHFGGIALDRILIRPAIGTATEEDLLRTKICELVDGVLILKSTGFFKSVLETELMWRIDQFARGSRLGFAMGPGAPYRLAPGLVRRPDVSFVARETWGDRRLRGMEIADFPPDLAVDVHTPQNTSREMQRKRREYFAAGVRVVWTIDIIEEGVWVRRPTKGADSDDASMWHGRDAILDGEDVLPGFTLSVGDLFDKALRGFETTEN